MSSLLKYEEFNALLGKLSDKNMEDDTYYGQYVLSPYVRDLGYDVFNLDETERLFSGDTYKILGTIDEDDEPIYFVFSLGDYRRQVEDMDGVRAYILIDKETKSITLYYYVLEEWYSIYETRLLLADGEDFSTERENLVSLNKVLTKDKFQSNYATLGERLFTGSVVDSLLATGDLENRFVRQALVDELLRPSNNMITMLASKLTEYSTQDESWLSSNLEGLMGNGLLNVLETAITNEEIELVVRPKAQPLPTVKSNQPKKQSEVATDISHKADRLKEAGFSADFGKPVEETKKDTGKAEDKAKAGQSSDKGLADLRNQLTQGSTTPEEESEVEEEGVLGDAGLPDIGGFFDV